MECFEQRNDMILLIRVYETLVAKREINCGEARK